VEAGFREEIYIMKYDIRNDVDFRRAVEAIKRRYISFDS
jgi:hypothetical protein